MKKSIAALLILVASYGAGVQTAFANGKIVLFCDEWFLFYLDNPNDGVGGTYITNVVNYFGEGKPSRFFDADQGPYYSTAGYLYRFFSRYPIDGYTWSMDPTEDHVNWNDAGSILATYKGIFGSPTYVSDQVLIDYVKKGGDIFMNFGYGDGNHGRTEFLSAFGFTVNNDFYDIWGSKVMPVPDDGGPIYKGVRGIFVWGGNSIQSTGSNTSNNYFGNTVDKPSKPSPKTLKRRNWIILR